jgi:hypothetical protein
MSTRTTLYVIKKKDAHGHWYYDGTCDFDTAIASCFGKGPVMLEPIARNYFHFGQSNKDKK